MDDRPPLVFANRVIRRFVDNLYSDKVMVLPKDFTVMRVVFRKMGGSWEKVSQGDIEQCKLIVQVVRTWGNTQEKSRKIDLGY